jgi:membrane protein implicated in regulation of membrane protease activity
MKKRLTDAQEFEILKIVLDKFLWIGAIIMIFGLWLIFNTQILEGIAFIAIGAVVLILLMRIIVKEYEIVA